MYVTRWGFLTKMREIYIKIDKKKMPDEEVATIFLPPLKLASYFEIHKEG